MKLGKVDRRKSKLFSMIFDISDVYKIYMVRMFLTDEPTN